MSFPHAVGAFTERQLAQQQRMKDCVAEAQAQRLRGEPRKAFLSTCLQGGQVTVEILDSPPPAENPSEQPDR
jgi:hypothetical protein